MNKLVRRSRRNLVPAALLGAALVTAGGVAVVPSSPARAAAANRVVVSDVSATERPTLRGTRVQVTYTLANRKSRKTAPRQVKLLLVDGNNQRRFGVAPAPSLKPGATRTFTTTRLLGPDFVEGNYSTRVCYTQTPRSSCDTTNRPSVTISPAQITTDADVVMMPLGDDVSAPSRRIVVTNTGQARTGPISLTLEHLDPAGEGTDRRDFVIDSTTCADLDLGGAGVERVVHRTPGLSDPAARGPADLVPGAQCTIDVTRNWASSPGATGRLVINGARGAVGQVTLTSPLRIEPGSYDFGDVAAGASALKTLTFFNDSDQTVSVLGGELDYINFTYDVAGDSPLTCAELDQAVEVPAGGSCTITVRFAPPSPGNYQSDGSLYTSVGGVRFQVFGTGIPGEGPSPRHAGSQTFGVTN